MDPCIFTENQQCISAPSGSTQPEPFCTFCLRERPANVEFYKHVIGSSQEMRSSLQTILGYDFNLANFAICKPCWKVMQLVQDFRLRCFKANEVVQRLSNGLSNDADGWFSAKNLATIESIRINVRDQIQNIEKIGDSTEDFEEETVVDEESLETEITIGETKVESLHSDDSAYHDGLSDEKTSDGSNEVSTPQQTVIQHGNLEMDQDQPEMYECSKCRKTYKTKKGLHSHSTHCVLSFPPADYFKDHLEKHGTIATFQCTQNCDKLFFSEPIRAHHERICAENARNLACETCGKRFKTRHQLRIHQWCLHSENARIFPCDVCGKMFKQKSAVALHMKTHSADKPFGCELCPMKYICQRSLTRHHKAAHS